VNLQKTAIQLELLIKTATFQKSCKSSIEVHTPNSNLFFYQRQNTLLEVGFHQCETIRVARS
jgi:hypothetical protein